MGGFVVSYILQSDFNAYQVNKQFGYAFQKAQTLITDMILYRLKFNEIFNKISHVKTLLVYAASRQNYFR